jgi:hypothetical protein
MKRTYIFFAVALTLFVNSSCGTIGVVIADGGGNAPPPRKEPRQDPRNETYASYKTLNIPPGHLPPPGQCKIWYPGKPPGQQGPPMSCDVAFRQAPGDAWVISREQSDSKILQVREKKSGPKVEIIIRHYLID